MLTYEALLVAAKERQMPLSKARGIVREYLQILILKALYSNEVGRKLHFTGGTYLRLVHGIKRFSEDLDFNTGLLKKNEFEEVTRSVAQELKRVNIVCMPNFKHWGNIYAADLVFPGIEKEYQIVSPHSKKDGLVIKFETNVPRWKLTAETEVISGFGELYPCPCTPRSALFADKIDALLKKNRGRHLYDIMFMLSHKYPVSDIVLRSLKLDGDPAKLIDSRVKELNPGELKKQAEGLRPFLFEEADADLLVNAHAVIPSLLEKYKPPRS